MANVTKTVFVRFDALYGPPKTKSPDLFFDEYEKALSGYDTAILSKALEVVIRGHQYPTWPTIGQIIQACKAVAPPPPVASKNWGDDWPKPTAEEAARVQALVAQAVSDIARQGVAGDVDPPQRLDVSRQAWEKMLSETPNKKMHGLTATSRRITGEHQQ